MTPAMLRVILFAMLEDLLGTYTTQAGRTMPAIYVGEPPSDYKVSGLECNIAKVPRPVQIPAYGRGALDLIHQVRLVAHGDADDDQLAALRLISSRWPDAQFRQIPPNESLGILSQHTITIPA